ncbi:MAG: hypothetical protein H0X41_04550 [Chitinophagaceae bacterium]|nr:hypothetical protein [Chitinophagaceae bacterium]
MYLAAGVPIIAPDIPGFKFLKDGKAGVLIRDYKALTIFNAIAEIENNISSFQQNCYKLFNEMCFDKEAEIYRQYLLNKS